MQHFSERQDFISWLYVDPLYKSVERVAAWASLIEQSISNFVWQHDIKPFHTSVQQQSR